MWRGHLVYFWRLRQRCCCRCRQRQRQRYERCHGRGGRPCRGVLGGHVLCPCRGLYRGRDLGLYHGPCLEICSSASAVRRKGTSIGCGIVWNCSCRTSGTLTGNETEISTWTGSACCCCGAAATATSTCLRTVSVTCFAIAISTAFDLGLSVPCCCCSSHLSVRPASSRRRQHFGRRRLLWQRCC